MKLPIIGKKPLPVKLAVLTIIIVLLGFVGSQIYRRTSDTNMPEITQTSHNYLKYLFLENDYDKYRATLSGYLLNEATPEHYQLITSFFECNNLELQKFEQETTRAIAAYSLDCVDERSSTITRYTYVQLEKINQNWFVVNGTFWSNVEDINSITVEKAFNFSNRNRNTNTNNL